jgi:putative phage-type endonuclease
LEGRRGGIGGSEAAALYDASPWLTPYQLWLGKTGRCEPDTTKSEPPHLYWGRVLEPSLRQAYAELLDRDIGPGVVNMTTPATGILLANTDGTITRGGTIYVESDGEVAELEAPGDGVYEGKVTTLFRKAEWDEGTPLYYVVQCQHYLAVTGLQWASVGVFVQGDRDPLRARDMLRHQSFIDEHVERCNTWWDRHVKADTPPPVDGSARTAEMLRRTYAGTDPESIVRLDDAFAAKRGRMAAIEAAIKKLEAEKDQLRNEVMAAIGEAGAGELPDGSGWTWRSSTRRERVVAASTIRTLRWTKRVQKKSK